MDYYYSLVSPPCQSVILVAKKLGVTLNLKAINVHDPVQKEALTKFNPQHTIPTLVDNGHVVWESYAIVMYLVEKYGKDDDTLYPKDPQVRSVVNQRLFFDIGTLYKNIIENIHVVLKKEQPSEEQQQKLKNAVVLLEQFVTERPYAAADHLTIADICLLGTVTALGWMKFDLEPYPHIKAWVARVTAELPDYAQFRKDVEEATKVFMASRQ